MSEIQVGQSAELPDSRILLGTYTITFDETGEVSIVPARLADMHFNITAVVFPPNCTTCFTCEFLGLVGNEWTFRFTLNNSTGLTGYDIRGILLDTGNVQLVTQPDSYTEFFASPGDLTPRNPFFIFDSSQSQNVWPPGATGNRELTFLRPPGSYFTEITAVFDASWPVNQEEPTEIAGIALSEQNLAFDGSNSSNLTCHVFDWQNDIDSVTVDLSPLGGNSAEPLIETIPDTYELNNISCTPGTSMGIKYLWITATSGGASVYNYAKVNVYDPNPPDVAEWTMMLYLHAANLPDEEDINELEMSGSIDGHLNLIILWDKTESWEQDVILKVKYDPAGYNMVIVSEEVDDGGAVIPPGGLDMSDPDTLEAFLIWTMQNFPANHYMIDLWDHGSGIFINPEDKVPFRNVCGGLSLWDIRDACQNALDTQVLVDKLDIIGFDVCLLGWMETAYCLRNVADIVIASQNNEPGYGWDYGPPFINLKDNILTWTAEELAYDIVEYYIISYSDPSHPYHYLASHCTLSACDIQKVMDIAVPALDAFCLTSIDYLPAYKDQFEEALIGTSYWGWDVSDIGHFAQEVADHAFLPADVKLAASDLVDAVEQTMINHGHTDGVPAEESGWNIWFPADITETYEDYQTEYLDPGYLEFYETQWDNFLYAYAGEIPVEIGWVMPDVIDFSDVAGGDGNGTYEQGEIIDVLITVRNTGGSTATNVTGTLKAVAGYDAVYEITQPDGTYPDLDPDETAISPTPYRVQILPGAPSGNAALMLIDLVCDQSSSLNISVSFMVDQGDILIIDWDSDDTSAPAIEFAIEANGYLADVIEVNIADAPMSEYQAVFITLGMWGSDNYYTDHDDFDAVEAYLNSGGRMYIESGDLWFYYPTMDLPDFGPLFGITSYDDGWMDDSISSVYGMPGTPLAGMTFNYSGDHSWPDYLNATSGAFKVMSADTYYDTFGCVVAYDQGTYKTIGMSIEFGGLDDGSGSNTKIELMNKFLEFLGL